MQAPAAASTSTALVPAAKRRKAAVGSSSLAVAPTAEALRQRITALCAACEERGGVEKGALEAELSAVDGAGVEGATLALNELLKQGKIKVTTTEDKRFFFRLQSDEEAAKLQGLVAEERLIFQEVERSGSQGILAKDLRARSNMRPQQLTKVLKKLETRRLVQRVKSFATKNKILYMHAQIKPSDSVTGGAFYGEVEGDAFGFDHEFVTQLASISLRFIGSNEDGVTARQVYEFFIEKNLVKSDLKLEDVRRVLQSLVYDARIEQRVRDASGGVNLDTAIYTLHNMEVRVPAALTLPCAVGPCADDPNHNAATCPLLTQWLERAANL